MFDAQLFSVQIVIKVNVKINGDSGRFELWDEQTLYKYYIKTLSLLILLINWMNINADWRCDEIMYTFIYM